MAGYSTRFMLNLVELTSSMADLIRKGAQDLSQWMAHCQTAFVQIKKPLCAEPLLHTPNISLPLFSADGCLKHRVGGCFVPPDTLVNSPVVHSSPKFSEREKGQMLRTSIWQFIRQWTLLAITSRDAHSPFA